MVEFFKNLECSEPLNELRFDDSYVEDIYGGVLENVIEVGTEVKKTIYAKNSDSDMVIIKSITSESPFVTMVVENPRLENGMTTPIHITFRPTLDELQKLDNISDPSEKKSAKEKLLKGNIKLSLYRVTQA
jgi:hypothetical protein